MAAKSLANLVLFCRFVIPGLIGNLLVKSKSGISGLLYFSTHSSNFRL